MDESTRWASSFRVEKRSEQLFVNGLPAQIHALKGGEDVELGIEAKIVKISGAEYEELFFADVTPTKWRQDSRLPQWHELIHLLQRVRREKEEETRET